VKTDFLGGFYASRSLPMAAQTCVNLYLEVNESQSGASGVLLGTPGLISKIQLQGSECRGIRTVLGSLYAVCGPNVYRISANFVAQLLGQLPNATGQVSITDNGQQVLFSHKDGWHYCTVIGNLQPVADSDQPKNSIVTSQDGYVLFTDGDDRFGITALNDVSNIDPLDIATAEGVPDGLIGIVSDHREAWLLCNTSTEIWGDTGNALFPFERIPGGMLEEGCAARFSIARADDSIFWLAADRNGNATVIRTNAYKPQRISTHALEHELEQYARIDDAIGYAYQQEGHTFYVITFPTADATWSYDCATQLWSRRGRRDEQGVLHRHRANCYAFFNDQHVVGDWQNGKLYVMDLNTYTDDGAAIYRERAWPVPDAERKRVRIDRVELVAEMGDGNQISPDVIEQVSMQVSHDGGRTFGYKRFQNLGQKGARLVRAVWRRLGMGRGSVLKASTTTASKVAWIGANVDGEVLG